MRVPSSMLSLSLVFLATCATGSRRTSAAECKMDCRLDVITPRSVRGETNPRFIVRIYDGCDLDRISLEPTDPASPLSVKDGSAGQMVRFELPAGLPAVLVLADVAAPRNPRPVRPFRRYREVRSSRVVVDFNGGTSDEVRKQTNCRGDERR